MSLPRLATRLATVHALRGATLVGDAVHDSAIGSIDVLAKQQRRPFIVVYTDDGESEPRHGDPASGRASFTLIIEFAIGSLEQPDPENPGQMAVPLTDAGLELQLDIIERQIRLALKNPNQAWAKLWRKLVTSVSVIRAIRGASEDKSLRFAARQLQMDVGSLGDPRPDEAAQEVWAMFLAAVEGDPHTAPLSQKLRAIIEGDGSGSPGRHLQRHYAEADWAAMGYPSTDVPTPIGATTRIVYQHPVFGSDDA
ncbi:MAG: hypothetical protein ROR55_21045 [Devosia sp.]